MDAEWVARLWLEFLAPRERYALRSINHSIKKVVESIGIQESETVRFSERATTRDVAAAARIVGRFPVVGLDLSSSWRVTTKGLLDLIEECCDTSISSLTLSGLNAAHSKKLFRALGRKERKLKELTVYDSSGFSVYSESNSEKYLLDSWVFSKLEVLELYDLAKDVNMMKFAGAGLRRLVLSRARFTSTDFTQVSAHLNRLEELSLISCRNIEPDDVLALVVANKNSLATLNVDDSLSGRHLPWSVDDVYQEVVEETFRFPKLTKIVLNKSRIRNGDLGALLLASPKLRVLSLSGCRDLTESLVVGEGDAMLSHFRNAPSTLEHVVLDKTRVRLSTVKFLVAERRVSVSLRSCRNLSPRDRQQWERCLDGPSDETMRELHLKVKYTNLYESGDDEDYVE